jgi:2'-5' RNA ligase
MRLFIAINLASEVRRALWDASVRLRDSSYPVKWVDPDGIHLTLKFLGEVEAGRDPDIVTGVKASTEGARRFTLPIGGFGAFPSPARPRVLWAGCEPVAALEILQHRLEQEMQRLGFPLEGRAFHPHLTLGRAQRDARSAAFRGIESTLESLDFSAEALVESLDLMESRLSPQGARYTRRHASELPP